MPSRHDGNVPSVNILPGHDCFHVDCRLLPGIEPEQVLDALRRRLDVVAAHHGLRIDVDIEHCQRASQTAADSPVVSALRRAITDIYQVEARPVGIGGATVAALLRHQGLPAAVWSRIDSTCHQPDEHSSITATLKDAQVFAHVLMQR